MKNLLLALLLVELSARMRFVEPRHVLNRKFGNFRIVLVGPEKSHFFGAKTSAKLDPLTSPPGFAVIIMVVWRF